MGEKFIICGHCGRYFDCSENTTICNKCVEKHLPEAMAKVAATNKVKVSPPLPKVIWEGKCWQSGQEWPCRGILTHQDVSGKIERKVIFEYASDKDGMGSHIWRYCPTPEQFILDAANMMDTAFNPNRT